MPNIKHLRKSLAWLDWRWRLQLLCQNIPSHRRRFWCMDLRGRFKFWHAWHTNFGSRHSVQVDKAPGTLQKMVDVTMISLCRRTLESHRSLVHSNVTKISVEFFPFLLSFPPVSQKIGGKNSPGLVGSTDCLWPLHWRIHCPGTGGSFQKTCSRILFWDTSSGGFLVHWPKRLLEPCQKETDSSCDLLIRWGQHIAIVNFLLLSRLFFLSIPNVSLLAWSKNLRGCSSAKTYRDICKKDLSVRTLLGIVRKTNGGGHSCSESHCRYGSPRKDHSRSERTLGKEFCWVLNDGNNSYRNAAKIFG